uniref:Uncharacterized protein n=1 Tax=Rhizophora mucronata TaxID=61149 RepID=A0A2P2JXW9_RHIMU
MGINISGSTTRGDHPKVKFAQKTSRLGLVEDYTC